MRYSNLAAKLLCVVLLLVFVNMYQARAARKALAEEENARAVAEVEAGNREIEKQIAEAEGRNSSPYKDGIYEGTADGFGGSITVAVTIDGGSLAKIDVLDASGEDQTYFNQAKALLDQILQVQGVNVDTVSGATFSSNGLIQAVTQALRRAAE